VEVMLKKNNEDNENILYYVRSMSKIHLSSFADSSDSNRPYYRLQEILGYFHRNVERTCVPPTRVETNRDLAGGDLTDFRQFSVHIPMWKYPKIFWSR
jgi:hypothetical protein